VVVATARAGDTHAGEGSPAVDEAGVEDDVDAVREPEHAHGEGRVARAAKMAFIRNSRKMVAEPPSRTRV